MTHLNLDAFQESVSAENWEYADADTQQLTHNIHRYSGKFIPQIASRAIKLMSARGEVILDPYCGSGTTLLEASLAGRTAIGVDLNPLAVLIARVKTTQISDEILDEIISSLREFVSDIHDANNPSLFRDTASTLDLEAFADSRSSDPWFQKWFEPAVLSDLLLIDRRISRISDTRVRELAWVAFSDILRKSSRAHAGYPNVMFDRQAPSKQRPGRAFIAALQKVVTMVRSLNAVPGLRLATQVEEGDARNLPLADNSVDAVVTHPPYIGSIPYAEYGVLSISWLGRDPRELDRKLTGGRRQSIDVVERFSSDYAAMLRETFRVLRPGRYAFLMVGNPVVKGRLIDLAEMTVSYSERAGFELAAKETREGVNRRANKMGKEHLLFLRKPSEGRDATFQNPTMTCSKR